MIFKITVQVEGVFPTPTLEIKRGAALWLGWLSVINNIDCKTQKTVIYQ